MYPISLFFVHLLDIIDTMQQSAKAKTTGILIFVSHTPFLNIFPAYHFFKKNLCSLKVVQTVITKAMNLFI